MINNDGSYLTIMRKTLRCQTTLIVAGDGVDVVYICDGNLQIIWSGQLNPFVWDFLLSDVSIVR